MKFLILLFPTLCLAQVPLSLADRCMKPGMVDGKPGLVNDQACADKKTKAVKEKEAKEKIRKQLCNRTKDETLKAVCDALGN